jgi:hypothetical protein
MTLASRPDPQKASSTMALSLHLIVDDGHRIEVRDVCAPSFAGLRNGGLAPYRIWTATG